MAGSTIVEVVPPELERAVEAAIAFINEKRDGKFQLTGLLSAPESSGFPQRDSVELGLVLCDGDLCIREQVCIRQDGENYEVSEIETADPQIPPHLDPPAGIRSNWLDDQLQKYSFVLLLYYRGLW